MTVRYDAYGDEAAGEDFVAYAFVCVSQTSTSGLVADLQRIAADPRLAGERLHCRTLFNPQARASRGLDLGFDEILGIYREVCVALAQHADGLVAGIARLRDFPAEQPAGDGFPRVLFGKKQLGLICAHAASIPLMDMLKAEDLRVWVDSDATRTEWLGTRRQASLAIGGYVNLGAGEPPRMTPRPLGELEPDGRAAIFQAADFVAWAAQRSQSRGQSAASQKVARLYDQLAPTELRVDTGPDGGVRVRVVPRLGEAVHGGP